MQPRLNVLTVSISRLWGASVPLTATGLLMLLALAASLVGLWLDPRTITAAPAWLKPAKFAASTAIYSLTLAWVFLSLPSWPRTRRLVGWTTAVVLIGEVAIIALQAWRGVASHFNVGTTLDETLFTIMGVAIVLQTLSSVAVAVALWRQPFTDSARGWALRLGMGLTTVGAASGGLMTAPTEVQLAEGRTTSQLTVSGAHTVGGPDGGPGLPGTGWSIEHGDLRVPHFLGLHALQSLPLIGWLIGRRRVPASIQVRLTMVAAGSYAGLFGILLWQALRGQPVISPDAITIAALAAWSATTALAAQAVTALHRFSASERRRIEVRHASR